VADNLKNEHARRREAEIDEESLVTTMGVLDQKENVQRRRQMPIFFTQPQQRVSPMSLATPPQTLLTLLALK
jgi:hypothetical protein